MQIDFNPMPATGDMMTVEAPPAVSTPTADLQPDGSGKGGEETGIQKDFRETMDDLLRSTESGEVNGDAHATPSTPDVSEEALSKVALLEITELPQEPQHKGGAGLHSDATRSDQAGKGAPKGTPMQVDQVLTPQIDKSQADLPLKREGDTSTPATGNGNAATGVFEDLKSSLQGEATASPKSTTQGEATAFSKDTEKSQVPAEGVLKETLIDPKAAAEPKASAELKAAAELKAVAEPKAAAEPKAGAELKAASQPTVSTTPVEAASLSADRAALLKVSGDRNLQATNSKNSPSQASTTSSAKAIQSLGDAVRAPQAHHNSGQQAALNADTAARATPMETPVEAKESQPQGFTTLVESIEKGGAGAKPVNPVIENPLDAVGTSGSKNMPNTQSASSNVAKADTATPQPLPKEEVIHQIVDSAKLRFQNGQGEMRIQLKPESLGHVRLNISTDQHQVMVKVVAELPMVKELLESNLPQLRAELQGQGLEIDKFDVSVGGDNESQSKGQQTWAQRQNGRRGEGAFAQGDPDNPEEHGGSQHHRQSQAEGETDGVDYFA